MSSDDTEIVKSLSSSVIWLPTADKLTGSFTEFTVSVISSESLAPLPSSTVTVQSVEPYWSSCTSNVQSAVLSPVDTQPVETKLSSPHTSVNVCCSP